MAFPVKSIGRVKQSEPDKKFVVGLPNPTYAAVSSRQVKRLLGHPHLFLGKIFNSLKVFEI